MAAKDYYQIWGLAENVTTEQIKKAYRKPAVYYNYVYGNQESKLREHISGGYRKWLL